MANATACTQYKETQVPPRTGCFMSVYNNSSQTHILCIQKDLVLFFFQSLIRMLALLGHLLKSLPVTEHLQSKASSKPKEE